MRGLKKYLENGKSWGVGGSYLKFPLWWGYGYFLELHMLPKTQKHHTRAKSRKPAEEILQACQHKSKMVALGKYFLILWVTVFGLEN